MNQQNIEVVVIEVITHCLGLSVGGVTLESSRDNLEMDSLDNIEVVMALEEEFGILVEDDEAEKLSTIPEIVSFIKLKRQAR